MEVKLSMQKNEEQGLLRTIISVSDEGIGMNDEDKASLFTPFFKSSSPENRNMNASGNGLGLSICKMIAEQMNGDILVNSHLNLGTKISLVLYTQLSDGSVVKKQKKVLEKQTRRHKRLNWRNVREKLDRISEESGDSGSSEFVESEEMESEEAAHEVLTDAVSVKPLAFDKIGRVIVAEDQAINLHLIRNQFSELSLSDRTTFCRDGQEAIDSAFAIVANRQAGEVQPISLMILDFQMPKKTGLQVVSEVKLLFADLGLTPPRIVFLTGYNTRGFRQFLESKDIKEIYEKPLLDEQLVEILMQTNNK